MDSSESRSAMVLELAEEFLDRYRQGQRPSLKEYIDRHPGLAGEIRDVFPAMAMMENIALADDSLEGDATGAAPQAGAPPLERLGDFRILREVGHGGMGIVYEAEQVSLGRHVALKVLPRTMVRDAQQLVRFEREARAAARLHHTNIVPVFGVGEQDGTPYYVMQFIAGLGLDAVIDELRQLRPRAGAAPEVPPPAPRRDVTALAVARSLLTGRFEPGDGGDDDAGLGLADTLARTETGPFAATDPGRSAASDALSAPAAPSSDSSVASSSVNLPGHATNGRAGRSRPATYWQSVARVGVQVAEALDYAHKQGVVHRDVKPSNLLLDARGTVWVTDFGLAKAGDQQDLTHTGDILGTLRYMPPEAFEGRSDARGDIYSLGLTLFELLAFRPAYEERDRNRLIKRVMSEEPPRLKSLNPEVPRDLETIVHKAIDRDPARRYATPGELSADLQRYLEDEPILARRTTPMEHCARWCRRNRVVASLAASLIGILIAATAVSLIGLARMSRLAQRETASRRVADQQKDAAEEARTHEYEQRQLAEESRRQAEAALQEAKLQRERAEANFAKARAAVDDYLTRISESRLLTVPGLQPLRRDLLRSALGFYQDFIKERGDDPSLRAELAATQARIGRIYTDLGSLAEARAMLEAAITAYQAALSRSPNDLGVRAALADTWQALGDVTAGHGKPQDVLAAHQRSIEHREILVRERPEDLEYQKALALGWHRLGLAQSALSREAEALDSHRRGTEIRHTLIGKLPDDPTMHYALGESFLDLADLLSRQGRHLEALPLWLRSQEFYRFAYGKMPHMIEYGCDLGSTYLCAGTSYRQLGRNDEALSELQKCVEHFRRMVRDHPAVPVVQERLIGALNSLASTHQAMGRPVEATRALREAAQWLDKQPKDGPDAIFQMACFHARQSIPVAQGRDAPTSQEQVDARREAERAIEQLDRAVEAGFGNLDAIRTNADLAPLRGRDDFKQLVAKLTDQLAKGPRASTAVATHDGPSPPPPKTEVERARQAKVDRATSLLAVGLVQLELDRLDDAGTTLEQARALCERLAKEDPKDARARVDLASTMLALGRLGWKAGRLAEAARLWQEGEELWSRAESEAPESRRDPGRLAAARVAIGDAYARRGLWALASPLYARAIEGRPGENWQCRRAAMLFLGAGDQAAYRRICARILDRVPNSTGDLGPTADLGWTLVLAPGGIGEPTRALPLFGTALTDTHVWYNHALALALYRCGRFEEAVRRLHQHWSGRWGDYWRSMGLDQTLLALALHRLGREDEARRALEEAKAAQSRTAGTIFEQAGDIASWNWWDWAGGLALRREAEQTILGKAGPDPPLASLAAARLYAKLGRDDLAEAGFRAAVEAAPDDPEVWLARGDVLAELGHRDRSEADLARAAALTSADPMPWIRHARRLAGHGDRAGADAAFARAARLTPDELNRFIEAGWWVVGPYSESLTTPCPPEIDPDPARPVASADGSAALVWRAVETGEYGRVDLRAVFNADHISAYALTYVASPDERTATLMVSGDDQARVWLNGRLVYEMTQFRYAHWDFGHVPVTLHAGRNTLLVKVSQQGGLHSLILRIADDPIDRGHRLAELSLWREAADQYDRALRGSPAEDLSLSYRYAALLRAAGRAERCRRVVEALFERHRSVSDLGVAHAIAMVCDLAPDARVDFARLAELDEQYADLVKRRDGTEDLYFWAALTHLRAGRFERALDLAHKYRRGSPWKSSLQALIHRSLGRSEEARRALADADRTWEELMRYADAAGGPGSARGPAGFDLVMAEMLYREAKASIEGTDRGEDPRYRAYQDRMRDRLKHLDKATADYDIALMLHPEEARYWLARGRCLAELGRWGEADADLGRAVQLGKDDPRLWAERGRILAESGQSDRADADYCRALDLAATAGIEVRDAIVSDVVSWDAVYDRVARVRPHDRRLREWRIRQLARRGLWNRAALVAGELSEAWAGTYDRLAQTCLLIMAGDHDGYRRLSREALDRGYLSDDVPTLNLADRPAILAPDALDDHDLAIRTAERASNGRPPDPMAWPGCTLYVLGAAHYRDGHYDQAVRCCRRSLEEYDGWSGKVLNWPVLALAYHRLGHAEEARKALAQAGRGAAIRPRGGRFDAGLLLAREFGDMVNGLELMVWLREAEAVILDDPAFPADPFATPAPGASRAGP